MCSFFFVCFCLFLLSNNVKAKGLTIKHKSKEQIKTNQKFLIYSYYATNLHKVNVEDLKIS